MEKLAIFAIKLPDFSVKVYNLLEFRKKLSLEKNLEFREKS